MEALDFLSLTPEQARSVGGLAILLVGALDLLASSDNVPFNTPRDWLLWLTQWRSAGYWDAASRARAAKAGRRWSRYAPFNYLPITGAIVPFIMAVLVGHFFHPGFGPVLGPGGFVELAICLALGVGVSVFTYFRLLGPGRTMVFGLVVSGLICGVAIWPVS